MELISVIVPCYNEQESLPLFYKEITAVTDGMEEKNNELEFEYIFVNDGSKDNTLKLLRELAPTDSRVRYISFSRNFGKEAAMLAGMEASREITWSYWTPISSTRQSSFRRCTNM